MPPKTYRALFFGTPEFAVPVLNTLHLMDSIDLVGVFTQPDKPVGRQQTITPPPVKLAADKLGKAAMQPVDIKNVEIANLIRVQKPDVVVIIAYGEIIPESLIKIPEHGWVNVHASLLPKYRGASPIQAAILGGDKTTGVTLMQIDAGLDTGPIIAQKEIPIAPDETLDSLNDKLSQLGADLVRDSILPYLEGKLPPQPQDNSLSTGTKEITKEDGHLDWSLPADFIERQIRAYTPWPGAFTSWDGKALKILKAVIYDEVIALPPGEIKRLGQTLLVGTGSSVLSIQMLQLAGKKPQTAAEFLNGYPSFAKAKLD